jgi:hypothetical protein
LAGASVSAPSPGAFREERGIFVSLSQQAFDGVVQHGDENTLSLAEHIPSYPVFSARWTKILHHQERPE